MKFNLIDYMSNRIEDKPSGIEKAPVVTISRQFGCSAKVIAKDLANFLNEQGSSKTEWEWVNKEIFEGVAKELEVSKDRILHVFEGERKDLVWDIFRGFSEKYYASDAKIRGKLKEMIVDIAHEGHKIIIGLGSVALLRNYPQAIHIKLTAPKKWRLERAGEKMEISQKELKTHLETVDQKRENLLKSYSGLKVQGDIFDINFNVANLSKEEITASIVAIMKLRGMV